MLIRESAMRALVREEIHRFLREDGGTQPAKPINPPAMVPGYKMLSQPKNFNGVQAYDYIIKPGEGAETIIKKYYNIVNTVVGDFAVLADYPKIAEQSLTTLWGNVPNPKAYSTVQLPYRIPFSVDQPAGAAPVAWLNQAFMSEFPKMQLITKIQNLIGEKPFTGTWNRGKTDAAILGYVKRMNASLTGPNIPAEQVFANWAKHGPTITAVGNKQVKYAGNLPGLLSCLLDIKAQQGTGATAPATAASPAAPAATTTAAAPTTPPSPSPA